MPLFLTFLSLYDLLANAWEGAPPALLLGVVNVLAFAGAALFRLVVYGLVRQSGEYRYTASWRHVESISSWSAFLVGVGVGYLCFGNIAAALLCGGCFYLVDLGVVLQALTHNERGR